MECCFAIPFLIVWSFLMISYYFWWLEVPATLLKWVEANKYCLIEHERRSFFKGPFFWGTSGYQVVYRITVRDQQDRTRTGWVRIGGFWWFNANRIEARWDEPSPLPPAEDSAPTRGNPLMWDRELDG